MSLFSVEERDRVNEYVLELAAADDRVVAGAVVGSLAHRGDRWSDLDLTFGVRDGVPLADVLDDWTGKLARELGSVRLFDLRSGAAIYRVFLLPGCLQVDLSVAPTSAFGARASTFRLLFGAAVEQAHVEPPDPRELFGYAVHHALRARFCIERGRSWQAEYWISSVRDFALSLACRNWDLPAHQARGFDDLPADVRDGFAPAIVRSLEPHELFRALGDAIDGLLREAADLPDDLVEKVEPELRTLSRR